jgi:hypothetical protein
MEGNPVYERNIATSTMNKEVDTSTYAHDIPRENADDALIDEKHGTIKDVEDMRRLGREQVLRVRVYLSYDGFLS